MTSFVSLTKERKMHSHLYEVNIGWNTGRKGVMCSPEISSHSSNPSCIEVATPPQFPEGMEGIWSPEHLFTAAVSSCLMTTFLAIAENSKLNFADFQCKSFGKLEQVEGKFVMSEIILEPTVTVREQKDREKALKVLEKSERACLISNSIKSKVTMRPTIIVEEVIVQA